MGIVSDIVAKLKALYQANPAVANGAIASAIVVLAQEFNVVLDQATVLQYVAEVAAILTTAGFLTRAQVTPAPKA